MNDKIPQMRTLKEMSRLSGISYDRLRKLCLSGEIVHIWTGNKILINEDRFIEYLNTGGHHEKQVAQ